MDAPIVGDEVPVNLTFREAARPCPKSLFHPTDRSYYWWR